MIRRIIVFLCLVFPYALSAQPISPLVLQRLLIAQDLRNAGQLRIFLEDSTPAVRAQAGFAAGSVQDTSLIPLLHSILNDQKSEVRKAAAFALGQLTLVVDSTQRRTICSALMKRLILEDDENVQIRIIEGLGKVGDALSLNMLIDHSSRLESGALKGETALSIGRYAYRGIKSPEATNFTAGVLGGKVKSERWRAAYALFRIGEKSLLEPHIDALLHAVTDSDADVRMYTATALGKILAASNLAPLLALETDSDWRVRVNTVKALAAFDMPAASGLAALMIKAFNDTNEHISLAALSAVGSKNPDQFGESHPIIAAMKQIISHKPGRYSSRQQREAAIGLAKLRGQTAYEPLSEQIHRGMMLKDTYVEALGFIPTEQALREVLEYLQHNDPRIRRLAVESAVNIMKNTRVESTELNTARSAIVDCLKSDDPALITTAASALAESLLADASSIHYLLGTLQRLKSADNAEPMIAIAQALATLKSEEATATLVTLLNDEDRAVALEAASALEKITGSSYKQMLPPLTAPAHTNFDWALLEVIRRTPQVKIITSRGSFTISMFPDEAPFTCINFASLIRKGVFTGLLFHRVVPNFVVQGGDPHGDGWGGPGYSIRSEFGYEHYERGMVGVASSGKDTEGSQFFATHSRQPHLDGRYTIFGKVTEGLDVIDAIQIGDTIQTVKFSGNSDPGLNR